MLQSLMTGYLSRSKRKRARIKKLLDTVIRCKVSATHELCVVLTFFYALFFPSQRMSSHPFFLERVKGRCAPL